MTDTPSTQEPTAAGDRHGWIGTEVVRTRFGDFAFENGYPTRAAAGALLDQLVFNRAVEVYLTQIPPVAVIETRRGFREFGAATPQQVLIWESMMDAQTLLLTANTETVYGLGFLDLRGDGPTVLEAPPRMFGNAMDFLQRFLVDVGPFGPDKGEGGKYLFLPPGYDGDVPEGYFVVESPTFNVIFGLRGFKVDGRNDQAVALMKQLKIYPLARADDPPPMEFLDGSGQQIDTVHTDTFEFYQQLANLVDEEPAEVFSPLERAHMASVGIEHGTPFAPDPQRRQLLGEAARAAAAIARANSFASRDPETYFYDDRQWQAITDVPYTFLRDGVLLLDRRSWVYYMALGNDPAMMAKSVGAGSQYQWTYRDADGDFLDGARDYVLKIPADVPVNNFWSVVVYDALSRSELRNDQPLPSVSQYTGPRSNEDGTVDLYFGPSMPDGQASNWIQTVPGHGWFPIFRAYGPLEPYFDKTWKLNDIHKR
jgi:hypothetical protein